MLKLVPACSNVAMASSTGLVSRLDDNETNNVQVLKTTFVASANGCAPKLCLDYEGTGGNRELVWEVVATPDLITVRLGLGLSDLFGATVMGRFEQTIPLPMVAKPTPVRVVNKDASLIVTGIAR